MAIWFYLIFVLVAVIFYKLRNRYTEISTDQSKLAVLITGCDSGFGYALAHTLIDRELTVFATVITEEGRNQLQTHCSRPRNLHIFYLDVRDEENVRTVYESVRKILSEKPQITFWGLVNNAGIVKMGGPSDWLKVDDYLQHLDINCFGAVRICSAFKPLIKRSRGRIVIVSSIMGRFVVPESGPYTMSKYALEAFAEGLRQDMYYYGVYVSILEPGGFVTALNSNLEPLAKNLENAWQVLPESLKKEWPFDCLYSRTRSLIANDTENRSRDLSPVMNAMISALFAKKPRARYVVGTDALYYYLPLTHLPERFNDWILRRWFTKQWKRPLPPGYK